MKYTLKVKHVEVIPSEQIITDVVNEFIETLQPDEVNHPVRPFDYATSYCSIRGKVQIKMVYMKRIDSDESKEEAPQTSVQKEIEKQLLELSNFAERQKWQCSFQRNYQPDGRCEMTFSVKTKKKE